MEGELQSCLSLGAEQYPQYPDLPGKVAVVTGGSRGLGAEACRALAANGVRLAVNGRDTRAIHDVVDELRQSGADAIGVAADCTDPAAVDRLRQQVQAELGAADILLPFAGGGRRPQSVLDIRDEEWRADVERNLTATYLTVRAFLPTMVNRRRGSLVTMASAAARQPGGAPIAYASAKAAIFSFTQQVAHEVGAHGVRANCLAPSTVLNERMRAMMSASQQQELASRYPLRRLGEPRDVANAALFLASDASSWITGVTLDLAGGQVMV